MTALSHIHRYIPGTADRAPLLLLHGTGGDESDLIPLGATLAPGAALLSPRGRVSENGLPRFFRRLSGGVFDEADLTARAADLADFVTRARTAHGLAAPVAVGFSNGANMAAALLLRHPGLLSGAVLLRAMPPFRAAGGAGLAGVPVLILSGTADPIVPARLADRLAADLRDAGAAVRQALLPAGHNLTEDDLRLARDWLDALPAGAPAGASAT